MTTLNRRRRAALIVVGVVVLLASLYAGFVIIGSATTNTCFQEGPSSPLASVSESGDTVTQHLSWWPLGRACEWRRADGKGTDTSYSGSARGTAALHAAVLAGAGMVVTGLRSRPAREEPLRDA